MLREVHVCWLIATGFVNHPEHVVFNGIVHRCVQRAGKAVFPVRACVAQDEVFVIRLFHVPQALVETGRSPVEGIPFFILVQRVSRVVNRNLPAFDTVAVASDERTEIRIILPVLRVNILFKGIKS